MRAVKPRALAVESREPASSATLIVAGAYVPPPIPDVAATERDADPIEVDVDVLVDANVLVKDQFATAPVLPRVAPFDPHAYTPTGPVMRQNPFEIGNDQYPASTPTPFPYPEQYQHQHTPTGPVMIGRHSFDSIDDGNYGYGPRPSEPVQLPALPRMVTDYDLLKKKPSVAGRVAKKLVSFVAFTTLVAAAVIFAFAWTFKVPLEPASAKGLTVEKVVGYTQVSPVEHQRVVIAPLAVTPHSLYSLSTPAPPAPRVAPRSGPVASNRL